MNSSRVIKITKSSYNTPQFINFKTISTRQPFKVITNHNDQLISCKNHIFAYTLILKKLKDKLKHRCLNAIERKNKKYHVLFFIQSHRLID